MKNHTNFQPNQIIENKRYFDSAWHAFQALSWLDYAERKKCYSALLYSALEFRMAIELLWFEVIIVGADPKISHQDYIRCAEQATKMYKMLDKLKPDYKKLVRFSIMVFSLTDPGLKIIEWDLAKLRRFHGEVSKCLYFAGVPSETSGQNQWWSDAITRIGDGAKYIWSESNSARTGIMKISGMQPEVKVIWEKFKCGQYSESDARNAMRIAQPILKRRRSIGQL